MYLVAGLLGDILVIEIFVKNAHFQKVLPEKKNKINGENALSCSSYFNSKRKKKKKKKKHIFFN